MSKINEIKINSVEGLELITTLTQEQSNQKHKEIMRKVLTHIFKLNSKDINICLKGGTCLMFYYNLDRFSEDLDFNAKRGVRLDSILNELGFNYTVAKDTNTVLRYKVQYSESRSLKIEISFRDTQFNDVYFLNSDGLEYYYTPETLFSMKINAFENRDKIRDIYDLCFIYEHYSSRIDRHIIMGFKELLGRKDLDVIDYIIDTQDDVLIDKEVLKNKVLDLYERLGLLQ